MGGLLRWFGAAMIGRKANVVHMVARLLATNRIAQCGVTV
jgi:hypothetical protein